LTYEKGRETVADDASLERYAQFAEATAREAGEILRQRFGQTHEVRFKGPLDMVTEADQASEALIAERVTRAFPTHDLLGEEGSRGAAAPSPYRWVIDPLDGTTNFTHGMPTFAVSIALEEAGLPIVGAVYDPMRDEMFVARHHGGATLNGEKLSVSTVASLVASLLVTGFSYDLAVRARQAETWRDLLTRVQAIRQTGSAALNLCYIAAGRLDGYWERGISAWDVAAGALMVQEAGGRATNLAGGPFRSDERQILATNGGIHDQLLAVVSQHDDAPAVIPELGA
jgi:myo-inositol-1(or 4)-monophosphatase